MRPIVTWKGLVGGALAVVVAVVCVRLGLWQLDRLEQRRAVNAAYSSALALPPLPLTGDSLRAVAARPDDYLYRRVVVRGEPRLDMEVIWRGRSLDGRPGVNVLTPYATPAGPLILVNRGWAASPDAARLDLRPLRDAVAEAPEGVLLPLPRAGDLARPQTIGDSDVTTLSVQHPDPEVLANRLGSAVLPVYVQQTAPASAAPTPLSLPDLSDEGPHFGYAIQWFSFATIALVGFLSVVLLRHRSRAGRGARRN